MPQWQELNAEGLLRFESSFQGILGPRQLLGCPLRKKMIIKVDILQQDLGIITAHSANSYRWDTHPFILCFAFFPNKSVYSHLAAFLVPSRIWPYPAQFHTLVLSAKRPRQKQSAGNWSSNYPKELMVLLNSPKKTCSYFHWKDPETVTLFQSKNNAGIIAKQR